MSICLCGLQQQQQHRGALNGQHVLCFRACWLGVCRFYECLSCCGTDLLLIKTMMPGVTDSQLKRKLKTEEKRNAAQVEAALARKRTLSLQTYEQVRAPQVGADITALSCPP